MLFALRRDRKRVQRLRSASHSRILDRSGCGIRKRDAANIAMRQHPIASQPCARMHALEHARRIIEMRCSWPSPRFIPSPFLLPLLSILCSLSLSSILSEQTSILNNAQDRFYFGSKDPIHVRSPPS